ncbi:MAG: hypothetical protein WC934_06075 [Acidithiobacillus sp.]|jgi:hypothetical protein|uniref:hypothetical protein n=1 Tax=Acidithiobacillus sp. TaxID=1872118 RepID=UPI00355E7EE1
MVEILYVPIKNSCFVCKFLIGDKCVKHDLTIGKLYGLVMSKNPYRMAENLTNIICDNGFKRKKLEKKDSVYMYLLHNK